MTSALPILAIASIAFVYVVAEKGTSTCRFGGVSCPQYKILKKTDEFEVRCYPAYKFANATAEVGSTMSFATRENIMKLFRYIGGDNKQGVRIPMAVPVIRPIKKQIGGNGYVKEFSMMFWLPEKYQCPNCAPVPNANGAALKDRVELIDFGERTAYVRRYHTHASEIQIKKNEGKLRESLDAAGIKADTAYDPLMVYSAAYKCRHYSEKGYSEVMFMKKEKCWENTLE